MPKKSKPQDLNLNTLLRQARLRQNPAVRQEDAARIVGVTRPMYSYYETGTYNIPEHVLATLAREWNAPELLAYVTSPVGGMVQIAYWGYAPAGPSEQVEADPDVIEVPAKYGAPDNFAVHARGDSMLDAIRPRDLVVFRETHTAQPQDVVMVRYPDQSIAIKRYVYRDQTPILTADNPDYPPVNPDEVQIVGRFVVLIREDI